MKLGRALAAVAAGLVLVGAAVRACSAHRAAQVGGPPPIATPVAPAASLPHDASSGAEASSPGCGTARATPHGVAYRTRSGRTFHVWGPSDYDASRPYPVVLTFHGWHASGRAFQSWFKMEDHVEGAAFVVYPDSSGPGWDLLGSSDLDFTAEVEEAMANAYCIDRAHLFALGFSYGGKFAHHLACRRPGLVRAISVGEGSWVQETGCAPGPVPVLVTHRTHDEDELLAWGQDAAKRWAALEGCSSQTDETDKPHGCVTYRGCTAPGQVTFCEDSHFDASWPKDWNHTIREEYRALTWAWFKAIR